MIIETNETNRVDKRITTQLRRDERDEKLFSMDRVTHQRSSLYQDEMTTNRLSRSKMINPEIALILKERPSAMRTSWDTTNFDLSKDPLQSRKDFHNTFATLIKLGSMDKQEKTKSVILSPKDSINNEVRNIIWLELQAHHADRTLEEQDAYLYTARQSIGDLLNEIMAYKYQRKPKTSNNELTVDSGIDITTSPCFGCLSMYCTTCLDAQTSALKQVEHLLVRLETAESLYPSSDSMGKDYPLYKNPEFVNRIKSMCLWLNLTKNHILKILILGKIIAKVQNKQYQWPITEGSVSSNEDDSGKSLSEEQDIDTTDDTFEDGSNECDKRSSQYYINKDYGRLMSSLSIASSAGELDTSSKENLYR